MKANIDGYYESMRVGTADNLTPRGDASEEIIMNRTAGGNNAVESGDASIKSIKGNSVVMTQLVKKPYYENSIKIEDNNGELYVIPKSAGNRLQAKSRVTAITGHLYLQMVRIKTSGTTVRFANYLGGLGLVTSETSSLSWVWLYEIARAKNSEETLVQIWSSDVTPYWIKDGSFNLIDLTQMFGAGNEPATLEEFAHRLGYDSVEQIPYIPYNEGEIVSCNAEGIRTTDAEGDTYERKWASTLQKYFPDGLKSAGTIFDEITPKKAVKKIGVVKMKDVVWKTAIIKHRLYYTEIADLFVGNRRDGIFCNQYNISLVHNIGELQTDCSIIRDEKNVFVKDSRYSTVESFINHFTEKDELYYELATPEEYPYDELNLSMRVAPDGKEEAIIPQGVLSTPLRMDVVYPIDAYATIVDNKQHIGSLDKLTTTTKTDLVSAINELKEVLSTLAVKSESNERNITQLRADTDGIITDWGG